MISFGWSVYLSIFEQTRLKPTEIGSKVSAEVNIDTGARSLKWMHQNIAPDPGANIGKYNWEYIFSDQTFKCRSTVRIQLLPISIWSLKWIEKTKMKKKRPENGLIWKLFPTHFLLSFDTLFQHTRYQLLHSRSLCPFLSFALSHKAGYYI